MSSVGTGTGTLRTAVEEILVPNILIFLVGWLMGATKILQGPAVYAFNMGSLYFIFPCAVFSGFLRFQFTGFDFFFFLLNIIAKFLIFIPAFIPYFLKKITLRMACTLWLVAVYNDAITYAIYYLEVFYTEPKMMTWISLSTVPSNIIFFPIIVFMIEYQDYKKDLADSSTGEITNNRSTSTWRIVLSIIFRVIKNPLVWAGFMGIILNQAVLGPKGKFPTWFLRFFALGAQCTMPINMFLLGLFTATYDPIHKNVMRFLCCLVDPIKHLYASRQKNVVIADEHDEPEPEIDYAERDRQRRENAEGSMHGVKVEAEKPPKPVWGDNTVRIGEEGIGQSSGVVWGLKEKEGEPRVEMGKDNELEIEVDDDEIEQEKEREREKEKEKEKEKEAEKEKEKEAAKEKEKPKEPDAPPEYKFNFVLLAVEIAIRHVISPFLMLVLCLIFGNLLTPIQKHVMVVMTSFGTGGPVFILSRQYNAHPGEAAITQVAGSFILNLVFFLVFYYICMAVFPLK